MSTPLVTIITITYNSAKYVKDAIESILSSSYDNFELIIGDDCSLDNTWEIINEYNDERIIKYRNEINIGEYPNRNKAIQLSKGEYMLFIDGDDMIYPHGLEFMTKMLSSFPNCGMALMRWYKPNLFYPIVITPEQLYQGIYFNYGFNDIAFTNTFFNLKKLKEIGLFPNGIKFGDSYIRLKLGAIHKTLIISDQLTFWRETEGQSSSLISKSPIGIIEQIEINKNFLQNAECPLSQKDIQLAFYNIQIMKVRIFAQQLRSLNFKNALILWNKLKLSIFQLKYLFKKTIYKDPFDSFSSENILKVPFSNNPFSKN